MGACCAGEKKPVRSCADSSSLLDRGQLPAMRSWPSKVPMTREELDTNREMFWDTQPHYGGRSEIWDALKSVLPITPSSDASLTIAVLQAAEIKFPAGTWYEVYDSTGFRYELPDYVLSDPTNLQ